MMAWRTNIGTLPRWYQILAVPGPGYLRWTVWSAPGAPGRLDGHDRLRTGYSGRQHILQRALLPLEHERSGGTVLAVGQELDRSLHAGERDIGVQVGLQGGVARALDVVDRLGEHLAGGEGFRHVGADVAGGAAEHLEVERDHLSVLVVRRAWVPGVGDHDATGVRGTDGLDERRALVRRSEEHTSELQ